MNEEYSEILWNFSIFITSMSFVSGTLSSAVNSKIRPKLIRLIDRCNAIIDKMGSTDATLSRVT